MEFWGVEVKVGESLKVLPELGKLIHISQAALGEVKDLKGAKYIPLRVKINEKILVLGALSGEERPQLMFDLVFEKEFELSHDWKNGSVYFIGYTADDPASDLEDLSDDSEDEPMDALPAGNIKKDHGGVKDAKTAAATKVGTKKEELPASYKDEDIGFDSDDFDDESDSEDSSGEEEPPKEKEKPKKEQQAKKRPADAAQKSPPFNKKAKTSTPNNTGNKTARNAIPLPSNKSGNVQSSNKSNGKNKKPNGRMSRK